MHRPRPFLLAFAASLACTISTEPPPHVVAREGAEPAAEVRVEPPPSEPAPVAALPPAAVAGEPRARREPPDARPLPTPEAGSAADITVKSAGTGALRSLRTSAAVGSEARLTTTVRGKMVFSSDGSKIGDTVLAPVTATWKATVQSVGADGSRTIDLSIEEASYDEAHPDARTAKAAARAVEALRRVRTSFVLDASGTPGPMETRIEPRALNDLRPSVEAMLMVVPLLFVPAPDTALGTGASWTASSSLSFAEMALQQTAQYRVTTQDNTATALSVTLKHTMPSPSAVVPGSRQVAALDADIEGTLTLGPGALLPSAIDAKIHAVQKSQASSGDGPMGVELVLDLQVEAGPAG